MKAHLRSIVCWALRQPWFEMILNNTLMRLSQYFDIQRGALRQSLLDQALDTLSPSNKVITGPFAGMIYPHRQALGSAFPPKLLGSYESELHPVMNDLIKQDFDIILNIGCAEGYYVVGLARLFPRASIHAFDPCLEAQKLCHRMALANQVDDRIRIDGFCFPESITILCQQKRSLVLCDAEGYERWLFSSLDPGALENATLLIEIHDIPAHHLSTHTLGKLEKTHRARIILPEDDCYKTAHNTFTSMTQEYPTWLRHQLVAEGRPDGQYWLFLEPHTSTL